MKKIICIGECGLDIIFRDGKPVDSMPGGRIVNAAALLAGMKLPVIMASEASTDNVGDIVTGFLKDSGVDISSVDRYPDGRTPITLYFTDNSGLSAVTRYEQYPDECFDIVWPRVNEGDIVLFGGFYALDRRMRPRITQLLQHCSERKAVLVYLPGFLPQMEPRITRIMPAILENLEFANVVIARDADLRLIFGADTENAAYHNHIDFYCRSLVSVDINNHRISYYSGKEVTSVDIPSDRLQNLSWRAGVVAGVISALYELNATPEILDTPPHDIRSKVLAQAAAFRV
ncbi:MAG: hypothetical protein K2G24_08505 [Muribaculaceae bacterium]|nr:hypothetical protein [Muribaculaceae bacterium]